MAKVRKLRPVNVVRVRAAQEKWRNERRAKVAVTVFSLNWLLFLYGGAAVRNGRVDPPAPMTPAFMAWILLALLLVSGDVLAVISLVSKRGERYRNRSSAFSFVLVFISIALAVVLEGWWRR